MQFDGLELIPELVSEILLVGISLHTVMRQRQTSTGLLRTPTHKENAFVAQPSQVEVILGE